MEGWAYKTAIAALVLLASAGTASAADWKSTVARIVAQQHSYPRSAQIRGDEGTAKVRLSVDAGGKITEVELVEPTGSQILDREAIRIPQKIGTVPPPPGGPTKLVIPIAWKLT